MVAVWVSLARDIPRDKSTPTEERGQVTSCDLSPGGPALVPGAPGQQEELWSYCSSSQPHAPWRWLVFDSVTKQCSVGPLPSWGLVLTTGPQADSLQGNPCFFQLFQLLLTLAPVRDYSSGTSLCDLMPNYPTFLWALFSCARRESLSSLRTR